MNYEGHRFDTGSTPVRHRFDTGATYYPEAARIIKVWEVIDGKSLTNGREFASMEYEG